MMTMMMQLTKNTNNTNRNVLTSSASLAVTLLVLLSAAIGPSAAFVSTSTTTPSITSSSTRLFGQRMKNRPPQRLVPQTEVIHLESDDGSDAWKLMDLVDILNRGGVGVLPTDTSYAFVTPLDSRAGLERLFQIRDNNNNNDTSGNSKKKKNPLSILCSDLSSIDDYCLVSQKRTFKTLKSYLPGPYTFLLPSKTTNRGMLYDERGHKHAWKRQTLGVRIPNDPIVRYLQDELLDGKVQLVVSTLPFGKDEDDDDDDDNDLDRMNMAVLEEDPSWANLVDFIVHAGPRPLDASTVYDMTLREPELVKEGLGDLELVA